MLTNLLYDLLIYEVGNKTKNKVVFNKYLLKACISNIRLFLIFKVCVDYFRGKI